MSHPGAQVVADLLRMCLESLTLDHIKHGLSDRRAHGITTKGVEVLHAVIEGSRNIRCCHNSGEWMSVAQWFAHRHDVRDDVVELKSPKLLSHSPHSDLHLIGNTHPSRHACLGKCGRKESVSECHLTSGADDAFGDKGR